LSRELRFSHDDCIAARIFFTITRALHRAVFAIIASSAARAAETTAVRFSIAERLYNDKIFL
jgi:hypothetical protein